MEDKILVNLSADANHTFESSGNIIGREGEGGTTRLEIKVPDKLAYCSAYLDFEKPNGEKLRTLKLDIEDGKFVYDVDGYLLEADGEIKVQAVLITGDGRVWKSSKKKYHIQKSINAIDGLFNKDEFVTELQNILDGFVNVTPKLKVVDGDMLQASYDGGVTWSDLGELPQGIPGEKGDAGNITINGTELKFFAGTEEDYDALPEEDKENLFAIIEDGEEQDTITDIIDYINEEKIGKFSTTYAEIKKGTAIELGQLPENKTIYDITSIGFEFGIGAGKEDSGEYGTDFNDSLRFSACRSRYNDWEFNITSGVMRNVTRDNVTVRKVGMSSFLGYLDEDFEGNLKLYFTEGVFTLDNKTWWLGDDDIEFVLYGACWHFA